eukprot:CAMPEP_0182869516 /NCGR_PEP_ID=MMETSP0034_2-20130328/9989_1 /TAXON_ID=156128 /ORGANISM="Nephroselmis pyriformis, Strain CCMP717" /LENGTH=118 /DNA_ID=CAMNT_0025001977 /DNA_START=75 /DNA_END=427 /DNA_ORIENTATION=-
MEADLIQNTTRTRSAHAPPPASSKSSLAPCPSTDLSVPLGRLAPPAPPSAGGGRPFPSIVWTCPRTHPALPGGWLPHSAWASFSAPEEGASSTESRADSRAGEEESTPDSSADSIPVS